MGLIKSAYIKYAQIQDSKYVKIKLAGSSTIFIRLKLEDFPHLAGVQYIGKFLKVPNSIVNNKILSSTILADEELYKQPKRVVSLIKRKLQVIKNDFDFKLYEFYFPSEGSKIFLSDKVKGDMITINKKDKKYFAVLYIQGTQKIYHPVSSLFFKENDRKLKIIKGNKLLISEKISHVRKK